MIIITWFTKFTHKLSLEFELIQSWYPNFGIYTLTDVMKAVFCQKEQRLDKRSTGKVIDCVCQISLMVREISFLTFKKCQQHFRVHCRGKKWSSLNLGQNYLRTGTRFDTLLSLHDEFLFCLFITSLSVRMKRDFIAAWACMFIMTF